MIRKFLSVFLILTAIANCAAFDVSSNEPIEYVEQTGELVARGDAKICIENFVLLADEIKFRKDELEATASGHVRIDNGRIYIVSDYIYYNLRSDAIHADHSRVKAGDYYFCLENLRSNGDCYCGKNGRVFSCDPGRTLAPSLRAEHIRIKNGDRLKIKRAELMIGDAAIIFWPSTEIGLSDKPIYVAPNFSVNGASGLHLQNDFYVCASKKIKVGGLIDVYAKRGLLLGPALKINVSEGQHSINSETKFGFIADQASEKHRGSSVNGKLIGRRRFFLRSTHRQHIGDNVDCIAGVTWHSDSEVERDFRKKHYSRDQCPDSFVELSHRGENCITSLFGRLEPSGFYRTVQRLPEFRFDYIPTPLGDTGALIGTSIGISRLRSMGGGSDPKVEMQRFDANFGVSMPLKFGNFLTFRPLLNVRGVEYLSEGSDGQKGKGLFQCGFDAEMQFIGKSNFCNDEFEISGLRHSLSPIVQYRFMPSGNTPSGIQKLDREFFSIEIPTIDLDEMRNVDSIKRQNMLRLGLRNTLYTRTDSNIPRELLSLDIFQDIFFARNYDTLSLYQKKLPDTHLALGLHPAKWLSVDIGSIIDLKNFHMHGLNFAAKLKDANFWELAFAAHHLRSDGERTEQYGVLFSFNLSSQTSISFEVRYDARTKKFSKRAFWIETTLCNSWLVDIGLSMRSNTKRTDKFQFDWNFRLLDF